MSEYDIDPRRLFSDELIDAIIMGEMRELYCLEDVDPRVQDAAQEIYNYYKAPTEPEITE